jgi:hypothetical protein
VPYLFAEPALVQTLARAHRHRGIPHRHRLEGQSLAQHRWRRSIPLAGLRDIAALPGVRLVSLQKGYGLDELERLPEGMQVETLAISTKAPMPSSTPPR